MGSRCSAGPAPGSTERRAPRCAPQVGALETIRVRILVQGEQPQPRAIRVELSCERNLFFHYTHEVTGGGFRQLQVGAAVKFLANFGQFFGPAAAGLPPGPA